VLRRDWRVVLTRAMYDREFSQSPPTRAISGAGRGKVRFEPAAPCKGTVDFRSCLWRRGAWLSWSWALLQFHKPPRSLADQVQSAIAVARAEARTLIGDRPISRLGPAVNWIGFFTKDGYRGTNHVLGDGVRCSLSAGRWHSDRRGRGGILVMVRR
jgi:hypothetical protein